MIRLVHNRDRSRCPCGDKAYFFSGCYGWRCEVCHLELTEDLRLPLEMVTSPHVPHVPCNMAIRERTRQPGTGEGNDYFGNHT